MKSLKFGVIGNPIKHSRSPEIHHHFADQQKIKISFGKIFSGGRRSWGIFLKIFLKQEMD